MWTDEEKIYVQLFSVAQWSIGTDESDAIILKRSAAKNWNTWGETGNSGCGPLTLARDQEKTHMLMTLW